MFKITFLGIPTKRPSTQQRHFAPEWPQGLAPGESVDVAEIPHKRIHGAPEAFLVDGKPYQPEKSKPAKVRE